MPSWSHDLYAERQAPRTHSSPCNRLPGTGGETPWSSPSLRACSAVAIEAGKQLVTSQRSWPRHQKHCPFNSPTWSRVSAHPEPPEECDTTRAAAPPETAASRERASQRGGSRRWRDCEESKVESRREVRHKAGSLLQRGNASVEANRTCRASRNSALPSEIRHGGRPLGDVCITSMMWCKNKFHIGNT